MPTPRARILDSFRQVGVRCTVQRYAILEYLQLNPTHPTAEQVHEAINRKDPRASLATVYKALHAMARAGLVRALDLGGDAVRFEAKTERHYHYVCERCRKAEDIAWFEIPKGLLAAALGSRKMRSCEVLIRGICRACA